MTSLHQIPTPILIPHFPCRISRRKSPSLPGRGLRRSCLLSRSDISLGLETRTRKMSWRLWKAKAIGRTAEVNEPEERKFRGKNSSSSFGKRRRKEEDQKRETPSTGGYHQTSSLGRKKGLRAAGANRFGVWRSCCRKVRWWSGWATSVEGATTRG